MEIAAFQALTSGSHAGCLLRNKEQLSCLFVYMCNRWKGNLNDHLLYSLHVGLFVLLALLSLGQKSHHLHKHQGLAPLIRSVSTVTAARANASSVFQLFSFLVVCSGMISKGFGFVAFFASMKASSVCIHLSCLVRL